MIKESKHQTLFNQYLREQRFFGYFELKVTTLDYFSFSKLEIHQYEGLQATEKHGIVWKLSDEDQRQKPCDSFCTPPLPSYLVIRFNDGFYLIRIKDVVRMRESGRISITKLEAEKIAEKIIKVDLKKKSNDKNNNN